MYHKSRLCDNRFLKTTLWLLNLPYCKKLRLMEAFLAVHKSVYLTLYLLSYQKPGSDACDAGALRASPECHCVARGLEDHCTCAQTRASVRPPLVCARAHHCRCAGLECGVIVDEDCCTAATPRPAVHFWASVKWGRHGGSMVSQAAAWQQLGT